MLVPPKRRGENHRFRNRPSFFFYEGIVSDMTEDPLVTSAAGVTTIVALASVFASLSDRRASDESRTLGPELVRKARLLLAQSEGATRADALRRTITAQAYMQTARRVSSDTILEQSSKFHIRKLAQAIDSAVEQQLEVENARSPAPKQRQRATVSSRSMPETDRIARREPLQII